MAAWLIRRFVIAAITVLGVAFLAFVSVRLLPGNTVDVLLQSGGYRDVETREDLERALGIDKPILVQFWEWLGDLATGDFGHSLITQQSIADNLKQTIPVSIELGLISIVFGVVIGIPLGILSAIRQDSWIDYAFRTVSIGLLSIPGFWIAVLIITYGAVWFSWNPPTRYVPFQDDPIYNLKMFWLPGAILGLTSSAALMRFTRTQMLEVMRQDYVRTAWSKGLRERAVILRHALKNGIIPVITVIGIFLAYIVGGSIIYEQIFNLPGTGRYLFNAINKRDYPAVQAVALVLALFVVFTNLLVDIAYALIDPRIRYK